MRNKSGFTLIEMMVVIAIIGILAGIVVPNLISWRSNHQLNGMAREIQGVFQGARLQAIKGNSSVTITFDAGAGTIVTFQRNRAIADPTDPKASKVVSLTLRPGLSMTNTFSDNDVVYNNRGMLSDNVGGTVTITDSKNHQRQVIVSSSGKPRIDI